MTGRIFAVLITAAVSSGCRLVSEPVDDLPGVEGTRCALAAADGGTCAPRPNIMLVLDKSGSMKLPTDAGTRLSGLQEAVNVLLTQHGNIGRFGLTLFPDAYDASSCALGCMTGRVLHPIVQSDDVDAELWAAASAINDSVQSVGTPTGPMVLGGTPTAATLGMIGDDPSLNDPAREDFVVLVTDGIPNCGVAPDTSTCTCSVPRDNGACWISCNCVDDGAVQAVQALRTRGIRTIVVGFGPDTDVPEAEVLLNQMAEAGGLPAECPDVTDAGTGTCPRRYHHAGDAAELADLLPRICANAAAASTTQQAP